MSPARIPPSLALFILLLIQFASSEPQPHWSDSFRRVLQSPASDSNTGGQSAGTPTADGHSTPPSRQFLEAHNQERLKKNQTLFRWDKTLARYARRWGSRRAVDCKMIHSYGPYGENLFWGKKDHWTPTEAVESWASEQEFYDAGSNECSPDKMCGHYTQIVWRDSVKLGCARVKCHTGGVLVVCEYDPPGNYVNESPFGTLNDSD